MYSGKFFWIKALFQLLHRHLFQKFSFLGVDGNVIVLCLKVANLLGLDDFDFIFHPNHDAFVSFFRNWIIHYFGYYFCLLLT